jgi:hypothetical protein
MVLSHNTSRKWTLRSGVALMAIAAAGFLTVADDLRHSGELIGVAGVMLGGVMLVLSTSPAVSRRLALQWGAAGIGLGLLAGAAMDSMLTGIAAGASLGMVVAYVRRRA